MNIVKEQKITKEYILEKVGDYRIFSYYLPGFKVNKVVNSCFRKDNNPSMLIHNKGNKLLFKDFGNYHFRGDCFDFVGLMYNLNLPNTLKKIAEDFGLTKKSINNYEKVISEYKIPKKIEESKPPLLQISTRNFTKEELAYWSSYYQDISDLKKENIVAIKSLWRNKQKINLDNNLFNFAYIYPDNKLKIYRPNAPKRVKETPINNWKWDTNLPFDYIENIDDILNCDISILAKSKKDKMVLRKALEIDCISSCQAEDPSTISEATLNKFNTCKLKIACTDTDKKGKEFSWWLTTNHGFKHCNVPNELTINNHSVKDFADWARYSSLETIKNHFKNKKLI